MYWAVVYKFVAYPLKIVYFNFTDPFFKITIPCFGVIFLCTSFLVFTVSTCASHSVELCMQSILLCCFDAQVYIYFLKYLVTFLIVCFSMPVAVPCKNIYGIDLWTSYTCESGVFIKTL